MKKIIYLPLDERPCNASFPVQLFSDAFEIAVPDELGYKKEPAKWEKLRAFLEKEAPGADGMVLSMDMLLYGGLVPSRIHHLEKRAAEERLECLRKLKKENPSLVIFAYQCVMRCPRYSGSDEEPDYYGQCGREIFLLGEAEHREKLGLCGREDADRMRHAIGEEILRDYLQRRAFNLDLNLQTLEMVRDGVIDALVVPQDDCAAYGYTAMDREKVQDRVRALRIGTKVLMYPGADELGLTAFSRMLLHFEGISPRVYVKMAAVQAGAMVPLYEDRPLGETLKYHLIAAGCRTASSIGEADIVLGVTFPGCESWDVLGNDSTKKDIDASRNLMEFLLFLEDALARGKTVTIADNAYANGGDTELISLMDQMGLLGRVHGYAGWNTSSNTIGTAVAEGVHALVKGMTGAQCSFLALRYVEDVGYCSEVRRDMIVNELSRLHYDYFDVREQRGAFSALAGEKLKAFISDQLTSIADRIEIQDVWMPWARVFEVGLKVRWNGPWGDGGKD